VNQADLLRRSIEQLDTHRVGYFVVGSMASTAYGEPRLTLDIDIVVDLLPGQVDSLCKAFPDPDFYVSLPAARAAVVRGGQFNVIHPTSGNKIDFMIVRRDAWGQSQMARRRRKEILPGCEGYVASPEDVILGKLWYYREGQSEKHLRDVAAMLLVSGEQIETGYIDKWAATLGVTDIWRAVLGRVAQRRGP
jgi:mannose-6-phosphate isomerase-like protein (cupin superfamily)